MSTLKSKRGATVDRTALYSAIESLGRLTDLMERRRLQLAREVGLTPQQWQALEGIAREGFMPSLFARARDAAPAGVSRTLRQLLERGLVEVRASTSDARKREYRLTAAGSAVLEALRAAREAALAAVWDDLPAADVARFARFGGKLADRLAAYASGVDPTS